MHLSTQLLLHTYSASFRLFASHSLRISPIFSSPFSSRPPSSSPASPSSPSTSSHDDDEPEWTPVYRLQYIRGLQVLSRLKIMQTGLLLLSTPTAWSACNADLISAPFAVTFLSITTASLVGLVVLSYFGRRLVGVVSVHEEEPVIRIGRLTFWGARTNELWHLDDVYALTDSGEVSARYLHTLYLTRRAAPLYMWVTPKCVLDKERFQTVFGEIQC